MKVAFVHYHLNTGGVTSVLKQQVAVLGGVCEVLVLTGDRGPSAWPCPVVEIPELGYGSGLPASPQQSAAKMLGALAKAWPGGCDLLHVHNPTLAKNRNFIQIIKHLQQSGITLFLQIHDFAEDGRPDAYFNEAYPQDCHYGVINTQDARSLIGAGLDPAGVHYLPNAIHPLQVDGRQHPEPLVLYPVRAIRRKNLGEAILLSLFFRNGQRLAVTQPPNSAKDLAVYTDWKHYVDRHRLQVDFDQGQVKAFSVLVGAAESMVTTSVSEGFGFSFLEPWTAGKPLWGRRLPGPCADFEANGVVLESLYNRLDVRLEWIDAPTFGRRWRAAVLKAAEAFGCSVAAEEVDQGFARITRGGLVDFALLNEYFQRQIITWLLSDPLVRSDLISLNPWISSVQTPSQASALIETNRRAIERQYSPDSYRQRLLAIYQQVVDHPIRHRIDKKVLWKSFFDLDRFSLLQWDAYDGV